MRKHRDTTKPLKNRTEERLRATPFTDTKTMEEERQRIKYQTWKRLAEAQAFAELLTKEDFALVREEIEAGLLCKVEGASDKNKLFRIYSKGTGLLLDLNENYVKKLGENQVPFLKGTIQAGIEGWGNMFWRTKGLLRYDTEAHKVLGENGLPKEGDE